MSINVVMLRTVNGADRTEWRQGNTYSAPDDFAKMLVGRGDAYASDYSLPDVPLTAAESAAVKTAYVAGGEVIGGSAIASIETKYPLPRWRKALGDAIANVADARIAFIGDSTTAGVLLSNTGFWATSPPILTGKLFARSGYPVELNSVWGTPPAVGTGAAYTTWDPRVVFGANWAIGSVESVARNTLTTTVHSGTAADILTFTPTDPLTGATAVYDTIDVYYLQNNNITYGQFTISDASGVLGATVAATGVRGLAVATRTAISGGAVRLTNVDNSPIYIIGIVCRTNASKQVRVFNWGAGGYASANFVMGAVGDFTTTAAMTNSTLAAPTFPHLAVVDVGINNRRVGTDTATFTTQMQSLLSSLNTVGSDIILCTPVPSSITYSAFTTTANQAAFDDAIKSLVSVNKAAGMNIVLYNKRQRWESYEYSNPLGFYVDGLHPSAAGYATQAADLVNLLKL